MVEKDWDWKAGSTRGRGGGGGGIESGTCGDGVISEGGERAERGAERGFDDIGDPYICPGLRLNDNEEVRSMEKQANANHDGIMHIFTSHRD